MTYKTRNLAILGSILGIIILYTAYALLIAYPGENKEVQQKLARIKGKITALKGIEKEYYTYEELIREQEKKLASFDKELISDATSASTYDYLNNILKFIGPLEFNLNYKGNKQNEKYGYNIYSVKGEGTFERIYEFIWYIERGPMILRINKITLRGVERGKGTRRASDLIIPFDLEIWAYYGNFEGLPEVDRPLDNIAISQVKSPFVPLIRRRLPTNTAGLLEVERADLQAIVPGKALIADHRGKIHELQRGDKVYLGYLTSINPSTSEVVFTLNKGGVIQKFTLSLRSY